MTEKKPKLMVNQGIFTLKCLSKYLPTHTLKPIMAAISKANPEKKAK